MKPGETAWGIGCYQDGARVVPWFISHNEMNRDIGVASRILTERGLAGKRVLWCSMLSRAGQFWPYLCGTVMVGAKLSCADATVGEAARVAMFLGLMRYDAVFGVTSQILDGLDELGRGYDEVFARVGLIAAHLGAYRRLRALGMEPVHFEVCGPALAIGREPDGPAFVAIEEWRLSVERGRVHVTSLQPRAQEFRCTPTGVRGRLVDGGIIPASSREEQSWPSEP